MNYQRFGFWVLVCLLSYISFSKGQEKIPFQVNSSSIKTAATDGSNNNLITNSSTSVESSDAVGDNDTTATTASNDDDDEDDDNENRDKIIYDYDEDYDLPMKSPNQTKPNTGIIYKWAKWPKWNKCSRTCGGGIQTRKRNCVEKKQSGGEFLITEFQPGSDGVQGCFGVWKKFRMCNQKPCPKDEDFRNQQCAMYNKTPYKAKFYEWEGYIKEYHECELTCKPIDLNSYTTLAKSVIDGTPCTKPSIYFTHFYRGRAVCIEGICKAVHKSGAIRGVTTNDVNTRCGSVLCRPISEIFSKATLPHGYFYITTIGNGAINITIKQMASSDNRLAIRSIDNKFIVNGNNYISESGTYEYNGDAFDYDKELQIIESRGPLSRPIDVLLLVRGINPGIKYDYKMPVASAGISDSEDSETQWNEQGVPLDDVDENKISEANEGQPSNKTKDRKRRKFSWKLLGFGPCNRSCGAGVRSPIFRCIKDSATRYYTPRRCMYSEKPVFDESIYRCKISLCPAYWQTGDYGECVCNNGMGEHNRTVSCVQEQDSGVVEIVDETKCETEKPVEIEDCDCPRKIRRKIYALRPDKSAKIYSGIIASTANVYNPYNQTLGLRKVPKDDQEKTGVWLMSDWNKQCLTECASGLEHRSIYCDRTAPYTDVCDSRITPVMSRLCDQSKKCLEGQWLTSDWGKCSGDCFNLSKKRMVLCIIDGMVVEDDGCNLDEKPTDSMNCTHREVSYCGPKWYYSEWFECSRSCGEGTQRRYAKCLDYDWHENILQESNSCKYEEREPVYGVCNTQKCDEIESLIASAQSNFPLPSCTDKLLHCKRMNKLRFCKTSFYQKMCCQSCEGFNYQQ